jgi:hypothetical protein
MKPLTPVIKTGRGNEREESPAGACEGRAVVFISYLRIAFVLPSILARVPVNRQPLQRFQPFGAFQL